MVVGYGIAQEPFHIPTPGWLIAAIICLGLGVVPVAVAIAILKYHLYDIDLVLKRALVYGFLAAFITAAYVTIVVGAGTLVGSGNRPNPGLSILAAAVVAVGFQPLRERVQRLADRLVYGSRATPYELLARFSERIAETYAAEEVLPGMARVLREGIGAARAQVWLRSGDVLRVAAGNPDDSVDGDSVEVDGQVMPVIPDADIAVPVQHQGQLLGALTVTLGRGLSLTPIEATLMSDLSNQAGLVLRNVSLTADLLQRLEELRTSRQRLVAAQDVERRRLERDLHDGAQQYLVAIKVKLGLIETFGERDPPRARALVAELKNDADEALTSLRDLARGIYPPILADQQGLAAALESHARKAPIPVSVSAVGLGRFHQRPSRQCTSAVLRHSRMRASTPAPAVPRSGSAISAIG